jgi:uncharacterized protein YidB (DUF937 family)
MDLNKMMSSVGGEQVGKMLQSLTGQVEGGVGGLISKLKDSGLQQQLSSWIGKGDNQPISAEQVTNAFGRDTMANIAQQAHVSPDQAASDIAKALPEVIDKATPDGTLPDLSKATGMLRGAMPSGTGQ